MGEKYIFDFARDDDMRELNRLIERGEVVVSTDSQPVQEVTGYVEAWRAMTGRV